MTTPTQASADLIAIQSARITELERDLAAAQGALAETLFMAGKANADLAARDAELAAMKAENSKLRSALEIVHFKQEPWQ